MFTCKRESKLKGKGRVYVFRFDVRGTIIYKVGMCNSDRTVDRFMEVLKGFFTVYRYVPEARILKYKEFNNPRLVEKHLHKELSDQKYKFSKKFDGSTEFFTDLDVDYLLQYIEDFDYHILLECTKISEADYKAVHKEIDVPLDPEGDITF